MSVRSCLAEGLERGSFEEREAAGERKREDSRLEKDLLARDCSNTSRRRWCGTNGDKLASIL
ncbi:hypothetical protein E2C01_101044 [Portunus trituberculatus]|uniref:Uncharacterized protein n=1 Tax=Portunus trituberculatus TaxID=210409 RepID=A0A5B7KJG8_PORTR|nr:hypothetical protein [Portunus trituberculatus]